ncbi:MULTISPECIES: sugar ABC transporter permease [unclassified Streptomyces]|uniref:carbohydrate ABC transporter permease n=1 Tax=unclassified Streptomyces TaxID=2593676 RepID=UPI002E11F722|nr:sugar ABC transporter permease [Streptomyces sp. NBC_01213]WSR46759.1 sugar ABC transporter permease [Streptomyces sp. NBC_01201]
MPRLPTPLTLPERKHDARPDGDHTGHGDDTDGDASSPSLRRPPPGPLRRRLRGEQATAWMFVSPSVLIILGLSVVPVAWSLLLSFRADDLVTPSRWVGLGNYRALVQDPHFGQAVRNTVLYTGLYVPASIGLGLALALVLNRRIRLVGLYRTLVFVPFVVSATAQGVLFSFVLDPDFGVANSVLHKLGVSPQGFLTDPGQALPVLVAISLWSGTGFCVVVILAALQDVPPSLTEAARLDGAGRWHLLRHVVLPSLTPVLTFLLLWQTINALQVFDLVYVTTKGGPLGSTTVIVYFIWEQAFKNFTAGYGAAAAYALALALLLVFAVPRLVRAARGRAHATRRLEGAAR